MASGATGQADAPRGGFWVGVGGLRHGQSDAMASPFRYRGMGPVAAVGYRRIGADTRFGVDASFSSADLSSALRSGHAESATLPTLKIRWVKRVLDRDRWTGWAGGQLALHLPIRSHEYGPTPREHFGDLFAPLEVVLAHELRLGPDMVVGQRVGLPVVAVVLRSPYTGLKYFPDVELAGPGRLAGLDHAFVLDRGLNDTWGVRAEWRTTLLRYPDPRELSLVTHRILVGLELHP